MSLEKIKEFYYNYKTKIGLYISFIVICSIFLIVFYFYTKNNNKEKHDTIVKNDIIKEVSEISSINIFVDIKGFVNNPGVYEIENGKRVIDLINLSGGLKENANTRFINLSKVLVDGEVVVIYSNEEIIEAKKSDIIYVETPCVCEKIENDACITDNIIKENDLININTASLEELMNLDGIGEAKASAIIEYRTTNGLFNTIEDIQNVSGISESLFIKIKENITV